MFTQTVGMTASDWPVFHVVKFRILLSTRKFFWRKYSAISRTPYLGENLPVLSLICWKNRSAYRRINTVKAIFAVIAAIPLHDYLHYYGIFLAHFLVGVMSVQILPT